MKFSRYSSHTNFVLGFHGCEKSVAEKVISGEQELEWSTNDYDWLGHGIYFWENNPERALAWAIENKRIKEPAVVGAVIDLGFMLSLLQKDHIELVKSIYAYLKDACEAESIPLPENKGGDDDVIRLLDCAVIESLHLDRKNTGEKPFDSVRGLFPEGKEIYPKAGFREENHVQICVRNLDCIKGYFSPIGE